MELKKVYRGTLKRRNLAWIQGTLSVLEGGFQFVSDDGKVRLQDVAEVGELDEGQVEVLGVGHFEVRSEIPVTAPSMKTAVVQLQVFTGGGVAAATEGVQS